MKETAVAYWFSPPTYLAAQPGTGPLLTRYKLPRGISVLKRGASYEETTFPPIDTWADVDMVYQGGHVYEVTADEKALLEAAGYTVTET